MHCEIQDPKSRNCNREFVDNEFDTRMRKVLKRIVHLSSRVPSNQLLCQSKTENGIRVRVKSFLLCHIGPHILCRTGPLWCCAAERRNNICGPMWHNKKDFTLAIFKQTHRPSFQFEQTMVVTDKGVEVLTARPGSKANVPHFMDQLEAFK